MNAQILNYVDILVYAYVFGLTMNDAGVSDNLDSLDRIIIGGKVTDESDSKLTPEYDKNNRLYKMKDLSPSPRKNEEKKFRTKYDSSFRSVLSAPLLSSGATETIDRGIPRRSTSLVNPFSKRSLFRNILEN